MTTELGGWRRCRNCRTELLVWQEGSGELRCCGAQVELRGDRVEKAEGPNGRDKRGSRFVCDTCGRKVFCTFGSPAHLECCSAPMAEILVSRAERAG